MPNSVNISKSPPTVALCDNGVKFELESVSVSPGEKAQLILSMSETIGEYGNNNFVLRFIGNYHLFTFSSDPDESGTEIRTWEAGQSFEEFISNFVTDLNSNYFFNSYFYAAIAMQAPFNRVIIDAKYPGSIYDITLESSTVTSMTTSSVVPGIDSNIADDYKLYLSVFDSSQPFQTAFPLGKELLSLNEFNKAVFSISEYLLPLLKSDFTFPFNSSYTRTLPDATVSYYINYSEFLNGNVQKLYSTAGSPLIAIAGGLNKIDSELLDGDNYNYFDYEDYDTRFLNHAPSIKITYPGVPELLFFLLKQPGLYTFKAEVFYSTGVNQTKIVETIDFKDEYKIIELQAGISDLLFNQNIETVVSYKVWIENDKEIPITEIREFILDNSYYLNKRVLFFKNSFDLYESVCFTGELQVDDKFNRTIVNVSKDLDFYSKIEDVKHTPQYTLNSGWLADKEHRLWLTELLISKDVFLVLGHILLPVVLTDKKAPQQKDKEYLHSVSISFKPHFDNKRYSSVVGQGIQFLLNEEGLIILNENNIGIIANV